MERKKIHRVRSLVFLFLFVGFSSTSHAFMTVIGDDVSLGDVETVPGFTSQSFTIGAAGDYLVDFQFGDTGSMPMLALFEEIPSPSMGARKINMLDDKGSFTFNVDMLPGEFFIKVFGKGWADVDFTVNISHAPVPLPASLVLLGTALLALGFVAYRRRDKNGVIASEGTPVAA